MSGIVVPQIEYISGNTPQESAALLSARIVELRFNNPSFERDGIGFWLTYSKDVQHETRKVVASYTESFPCCSECAYFERASERVKWGTCSFHRASVDINKRICEEFHRNLGGDELNA